VTWDSENSSVEAARQLWLGTHGCGARHLAGQRRKHAGQRRKPP
jgi:hypothetical protein